MPFKKGVKHNGHVRSGKLGPRHGRRFNKTIRPQIERFQPYDRRTDIYENHREHRDNKGVVGWFSASLTYTHYVMLLTDVVFIGTLEGATAYVAEANN